MNELVHALERKNLCLESFLQISQALLVQLEAGSTDSLDVAQSQRQTLIQVIEQLDEVIQKARPLASDSAKIQELFGIKDKTIRKILALDAAVLKQIEKIKTETIARLQAVQAHRQTLKAYRSPLDSIHSQNPSTILDKEV